LKSQLDAGEKILLIDVRDASLYEKETIPGAINIPFAHLENALKDIPAWTAAASGRPHWPRRHEPADVLTLLHDLE
jgi:rhodanese-related sulfurtransferase